MRKNARENRRFTETEFVLILHQNSSFVYKFFQPNGWNRSNSNLHW